MITFRLRAEVETLRTICRAMTVTPAWNPSWLDALRVVRDRLESIADELERLAGHRPLTPTSDALRSDDEAVGQESTPEARA
ncbi:MAG: hypothetical protein Q8S13_07100 [Dehalococcoidia bacterium]|nr:hypothetical protein [Dehalococcoidia bacterium]